MKKLITSLCLLLIWQNALLAALPVSTAWEMRTTGADTNSGGFTSGIGTTVISAQADLAYSSGSVSSAGHNFVTADQFRYLSITASSVWGIVLSNNGGSGCTSATVAFSGG